MAWHGEYLLQRRYALGKLGRPLSFSKSCNIYMYIFGVSFFRASPIVFQLNPSKPCLNVTSNHETIHDNSQHGSYQNEEGLDRNQWCLDIIASRHPTQMWSIRFENSLCGIQYCRTGSFIDPKRSRFFLTHLLDKSSLPCGKPSVIKVLNASWKYRAHKL